MVHGGPNLTDAQRLGLLALAALAAVAIGAGAASARSPARAAVVFERPAPLLRLRGSGPDGVERHLERDSESSPWRVVDR